MQKPPSAEPVLLQRGHFSLTELAEAVALLVGLGLVLASAAGIASSLLSKLAG